MVVDDLNIEGQIHKRMVKFINSIITSHNPLLSRCGKLIREGSRSNLSNSIHSIFSRYNVQWKMLYDVKLIYKEISQYYSMKTYTELDFLYAENIKILLCQRDNVMKSSMVNILTYEELNILLDYFCTNCNTVITV